jgi:hypothetical protein
MVSKLVHIPVKVASIGSHWLQWYIWTVQTFRHHVMLLSVLNLAVIKLLHMQNIFPYAQKACLPSGNMVNLKLNLKKYSGSKSAEIYSTDINPFTEFHQYSNWNVGWGLTSERGRRFFSFLPCPDCSGAYSSNQYQGFFPQG